MYCENGATCVDGDGNYTCACVVGYTDFYCSIEINECQDVICQHGGTCQDYVGYFQCDCKPGFTDVYCETGENDEMFLSNVFLTDIDDCESDPCVKGACFDGVVLYWCDCDPGYTGYDCEIGAKTLFITEQNCSADIDECESTPCVHNATCDDRVNHYFCVCLAGMSGPYCAENVDECSSTPCQHNSTCLDYVNYYQCHCEPGYSGPECQIGRLEALSEKRTICRHR